VVAVTWAILGFATLALGAIVGLALDARSARKEQLAARDLLDKAHEELRNVEGDLKVETAAHVATADELRKERLLRASAEAERNEAWRQARDHIIEEINAMGIADAAAIGNRLLSRPLPGTRLSETVDGALEKP
jgi:hypothetical protein